jgi:hypothetical protein
MKKSPNGLSGFLSNSFSMTFFISDWLDQWVLVAHFLPQERFSNKRKWNEGPHPSCFYIQTRA